ncbi:MAG: glycoside hydrolase family 15 protein [Actinomycetota bacterium]|nr:glycoside hydrolase family 15 protein [Actinomycetota bacterium]
MSTTPIADYALISDCHSAALVSRSGSIDWLCRPRFDSPAVFARILDQSAGHHSIAPTGEFTAERRYLDRTMVLETTFRTDGGTAVLTDAMALDPTEHGHDLGAGASRALLRRIECTSGEVEIEVEFAPRPEYGLISPLLAATEAGIEARGGAMRSLLSTDRPATIEGSTARFRFSLREGEDAGFAQQWRTSFDPDQPAPWTQDQIAKGIEGTVEAWRTWSGVHQAYEGPWEDLVYHSGRVLQALMYQPTGAIVAAPTTSLPEGVGGERNWDYRYAWVRDASFTLDALWVAACPDEALKFFSWMTGAVASQVVGGRDLQIMFGIGGEHDLSERTLPHLSGWRDSRPVRVGNGAWDQRQLDVYGELLDAAYRLRDQLSEIDEATKAFLVQVADAAASRWQEKDQGIWEVRGEPRDFLYSKLMCWVALDRAIDMAPLIGGEARVEDWTRTRDEIRAAIQERGWSDQAGAFTQYFGGSELDASNLMMAIVGFLPADDPRMLATIDATERDLTDDRGLVFRYRAEEGVDGLEGTEGTFLLCTFWLAEALARAGKVDRARAVFERAIAFANDVGLLAEEVDEETGELLGNFPQAFSHIGLINAAWAISQAESSPGV